MFTRSYSDMICIPRPRALWLLLFDQSMLRSLAVILSSRLRRPGQGPIVRPRRPSRKWNHLIRMSHKSSCCNLRIARASPLTSQRGSGHRVRGLEASFRTACSASRPSLVKNPSSPWGELGDQKGGGVRTIDLRNCPLTLPGFLDFMNNEVRSGVEITRNWETTGSSIHTIERVT